MRKRIFFGEKTVICAKAKAERQSCLLSEWILARNVSRRLEGAQSATENTFEVESSLEKKERKKDDKSKSSLEQGGKWFCNKGAII